MISSFVRFAQEFSERANYISAGLSKYISDDGRFQINYLNDITDSATGKVLPTPARIDRYNGVIEVSKAKFESYTVPMRFAILLHEFAHFYLNEDMANETEADLNALLIYLGLGYPRIEALNVFTKVFITAPTEMNVERLKKIDDFIVQFEKKFVSMAYDKGQLSRMERNTKKKAAA